MFCCLTPIFVLSTFSRLLNDDIDEVFLFPFISHYAKRISLDSLPTQTLCLCVS